MLGVLEGFGVVSAVVLLGVVLAHVGFLDLGAQRVLTRLSVWVATPALLISLVADADVARLVGVDAMVHGIAVLVVVALGVPLWRLVFHRDLGETTVGVMTATYSNSVNLGLPIAVYALGDATAVLPLLMMQLVVMQPVALTMLDAASGRGRLTLRRALRPLVNPLILATAVGLVLAFTGWTLPTVVSAPMDLVGAMAVPAMLLAFGISLRLGPRPGASAGWAPTLCATVLKLVVMPLVAVGAGLLFFDLHGEQLLAVTVIAALPTAQNVYAISAVYRQAENFARDVVFLSSVLAIPAVLVIAGLLG